MLKLYQREECPACAQVRRFLATHNLPVESVYVPRLASQRQAVMGLKGLDTPEVPVLVDDDRVIQGSDDILAYLEEKQARFDEIAEAAFGRPA